MAFTMTCPVPGFGKVPCYALITEVQASRTHPGALAVVEQYRDQATRVARGQALALRNARHTAMLAASAALEAKKPPPDATPEVKRALEAESMLLTGPLAVAQRALGDAQAALDDPDLMPLPGTIQVQLPPSLAPDGQLPDFAAIYAYLKTLPAFAEAVDA